MIAFLAALCVALLAALLLACARLEHAMARLLENRQAEHAKCIAHIASVVSNKMVATSLRQLAEKYDDPIEVATTTLELGKYYTPGGPSVPAMWLARQADLIEAFSTREAKEATSD